MIGQQEPRSAADGGAGRFLDWLGKHQARRFTLFRLVSAGCGLRVILRTSLLAALLIESGGSPVLGQIGLPPQASNALAKVLFDVEDLRLRVENITVYSEYCKPPHPKNKLRTQAQIDREAADLVKLWQAFAAVEKSFLAAGNTRIGLSFRGSFPVIDGLTAEHRDYWPSARRLLTQVQNLLEKKTDQLGQAPLGDCIETPAQAQTKPPQPPPDPLAGVQRPVPREIIFPSVPAYFCSEFERNQWYLDHFASEWNEAADNVADASAYRAEVSRRGAAHANRGGAAAPQKRLDAEEGWADRNLAEHVRVREQVDATRDIIRNTPIIDCSLLKVRYLVDQNWHERHVAELRAEIKDLDGAIAQTEKKIADADYQANSMEAEFSAIGTLEGQYFFDLWQELHELRRWRDHQRRKLGELRWDRGAAQAELERALQDRDRIQRADANSAGIPRLTIEPEAKGADKQPGWLDKLAPVLIPQIGIGVGGGRGGDSERRYPDRR